MAWQPRSCRFSRWGHGKLLPMHGWQTPQILKISPLSLVCWLGMPHSFPILWFPGKGCQPVCFVWETSAVFLRRAGLRVEAFSPPPVQSSYRKHIHSLLAPWQQRAHSPALAGGKSCWHTSPSLLFHLLSKFTQHRLKHPSNWNHSIQKQGGWVTCFWDLDLSDDFLMCFCWVMSYFPGPQLFFSFTTSAPFVGSSSGWGQTQQCLPGTDALRHCYSPLLTPETSWKLPGRVVGLSLLLRTLPNFSFLLKKVLHL